MKKTALFLLPVLATFLVPLSSCDFNKETRIVLTYGDVHQENVDIASESYQYDISYDALKEKIEKGEENFLLVTYTSGCTCWLYLSELLNDYIKNNNVIIYRLKSSDFDSKEKFGLTISSNENTFAVIEHGKVKYCLCGDTYPELTDVDKFKNFMKKSVFLPRMYYINQNDVDYVITEDPSIYATIYFAKKDCPDCNAVNPNILIPYFEKHATMPLYIFDISEFSSQDGYQDFKNYYYLSQAGDPTYGYGNGVVPTFISFNNGQPISAAVAYNDTLEQVDNGYKIVNSYYTNERKEHLSYLENFKGTSVLKDLVLSSDEVEQPAPMFYRWKYKNASKYYRPLIERFLDESLKKENYNVL